MLVRCGACNRLVRSGETICPFCSKNLRRRIVGKFAAKIAVGAIGGATAMLSGVGCVYGCPEPGCNPIDSGTKDVAQKDVVDESPFALDAAKDVAADVENEAGDEGGVTDASDSGAD